MSNAGPTAASLSDRLEMVYLKAAPVVVHDFNAYCTPRKLDRGLGLSIVVPRLAFIQGYDQTVKLLIF